MDDKRYIIRVSYPGAHRVTGERTKAAALRTAESMRGNARHILIDEHVLINGKWTQGGRWAVK